MAKPAYNDRGWRSVRRAVLARDAHRCQIAGAGCTVTATQVDHIVPLVLGGKRLEPSNLRAACAHCNAARTANTRRPGHNVAPLTW